MSTLRKYLLYGINLPRLRNGIISIGEKQYKAIFPIIFFFLMLICYHFGRVQILSIHSNIIAKVSIYMYDFVCVFIAVIGILRIISRIGKPFLARSVELALKNVGFVDKHGDSPMLLSKSNEEKVSVYTFYSKTIPLKKYRDSQELIETALNVNVLSLDSGKDCQHVIMKAVKANQELPEVINWNDDFLPEDDLVVCLGESMLGREYLDFNVNTHALIGGSTNSGKTKLAKLIAYQLIKRGARIIIIDLKGGLDYQRDWSNKCNLVTEIEHVEAALRNINTIMNSRHKILKNTGYEDAYEYNKHHCEKMSPIIVLIDELAELLDTKGLSKEQKSLIESFVKILSSVSRIGRFANVHMIMSTQRPDANVLEGQIKSNIDFKVVGKCDSVLSKIVLDNADGAEKVAKNQRGMFYTNTGKLFRAYLLDNNVNL